MQQLALPLAQRWREQRCRWRRPGELFNPSAYGVEVIDSDRIAKSFVERHHYSGTYPAARFRVGLYRMRELVGVAVFSNPMSQRVIPKWTGLADPLDGVELGRLVLLDDVAYNGESWFLARAFKALVAEKGIRAVLSCADPVPRRVKGAKVLPGHVGIIYQALNGRYAGRTSRKTLHIGRGGRIFDRRSISKLKNDERGAGYVYEAMRAEGAPARQLGEPGPAYVKRALAAFTRVRHPGNHAYVWAVGPGRKHTNRGLPDALPYPGGS